MSIVGQVHLTELCTQFGVSQALSGALFLPALVDVLLKDGLRYLSVVSRLERSPRNRLHLLVRMVHDHTVLRSVRWSLLLSRLMQIHLVDRRDTT